ncbi:aminotransferase class I/II-fold pyridoxal phosphate-dependent enzyme [Candidatus Lokiarchaeum ossiferum]|uniref:aminotransferase class I/II-fold pyridoxal phosphate-dependent enzyme n=1 Tax=Candidatus Lokiarchaeum ossiferum TaxID=2951803 RepID=UPI00352FB1D2
MDRKQSDLQIIPNHASHGGEVYSQNLNNKKILDFSVNVNHLFKKSIVDMDLKDLLETIDLYPDSNSTRLKELLIKISNNAFTRNQIIVGNGAMDLITVFSDAFFTKNDEIIVVQPTFTEYEWAITKNQAKIINIFRLPENDFKLPMAEIFEFLSQSPKAIFICNPNNPNGSLDAHNDIKNILKQALNSETLVFLDEAFIEFVEKTPRTNEMLEQCPNLFICRSFTKFYGIPGLRIGYGLGSQQMISKMKSYQNLWSVNTVAQELMGRLIGNTHLQELSREYYTKERKFMFDEINSLYGFKPYPSNANFLLVNLENLGMNSADVKTRLVESNILIRDCATLKGLNDKFIRIAIKDHESNLKIIQEFKKIVNSGGMHPKGIDLINQALALKHRKGKDLSCPYFPCHKQLEDCTFCYCPFYPCHNPISGGNFITSQKTGKKIWNCADCILSHKASNVDIILTELINLKSSFQEITHMQLMEIHKKIIDQDEAYHDR